MYREVIESWNVFGRIYLMQYVNLWFTRTQYSNSFLTCFIQPPRADWQFPESLLNRAHVACRALRAHHVFSPATFTLRIAPISYSLIWINHRHDYLILLELKWFHWRISRYIGETNITNNSHHNTSYSQYKIRFYEDITFYFIYSGSNNNNLTFMLLTFSC